ncbi:hypothetical protein Tfer_2751 [Thermincola ferriacetica]|uniref:AAA domain-containing protein n=1 Tax=Thermincola ferriacetica TaxID=281456 RepID=A0A0L6VZG2_9FIRM|nr:DUF3696 domain-containing protein [Thermincola ferriacetica]KNZ68660.1 hypothetical protein Tfer_2751 [Thermincola ferriacetica]
MNSFRLKNIKGFIDTGKLEIKPITIMIGENSSGKSSIVRFPLVLRQTFLDASMAPLLLYGKSIDYGNFEDVVFGHDKKQPIEFEISIDVRDLLMIVPPFYEEKIKNYLCGELIINVTISYSGKALRVDKFCIYSSDSERPVLSVENIEENEQIKITFKDRRYKYEISKKEFGFEKFIPDFRSIRVIGSKIKSKNKKESLDFLYALFTALNFYFNSFANKIFYIGPFRKTPERFYRYIENAVNYVGRDGEFASVILGQNLRTNQTLIEDVSNWLEKNLDFTLEVEDLKGDLFRIMIKDKKTNAKNNIIDVGHGLSQLLPIVVQTFMKTPNENYSLFYNRMPLYNLHIIEQPELHLHPAGQASLADLFVGAVNRKAKSKDYFLIETHSEHMLLRLRRYVVEERISPKNIAIYYSEKNSKHGSLDIRRLEISEEGKIKGWPEGFFSQDYIETIAMQDALRKKTLGGESPLW